MIRFYPSVDLGSPTQLPIVGWSIGAGLTTSVRLHLGGIGASLNTVVRPLVDDLLYRRHTFGSSQAARMTFTLVPRNIVTPIGIGVHVHPLATWWNRELAPVLEDAQ